MTDPIVPDETPATLTVQQVAEIVNAAITSHMKRQPDVSKVVAQALDEFKKSLPTALAEETPSGKGGKTESNAQMAALQAKLDEMSKAVTSANDARLAAEKQQRQDRAFSEVKSALAGKVRPEAINDVADLLQARGRIELDENGTPFLKVKRAPAPGLQEEDTLMPLTDGIDAYLKKDGAIFVPAPNGSQPVVQPRGSRMPTTTIPKGAIPKYEGEATTDAEKIQRAMDMEVALRAQGHG